VGVFLAYVKDRTWTWVDGELYLPEVWFTPAWAKRHQKALIPPDRRYQKKSDLGWQMIERAQAVGLPFVAVAFDSAYGHETALRDRCRAAGIEYYADLKGGDLVYFDDPTLPLQSPHLTPSNWLQQHGFRVSEWVAQQDVDWHTLTLRPDARGFLVADFAAYPVWTVRDDGRVVRETLLLRRAAKRITFTLTNAPPDTSLDVLASRKSQRYFIEKSIQDAKSELGFDEFQALKYRAWEHHLALPFSPVGSSPKPALTGPLSIPPIPPCPTTTTWTCFPLSPSPMSATCYAPHSPCHSFPRSRLPC
jgi:SRSO17 transposase